MMLEYRNIGGCSKFIQGASGKFHRKFVKSEKPSFLVDRFNRGIRLLTPVRKSSLQVSLVCRLSHGKIGLLGQTRNEKIEVSSAALSSVLQPHYILIIFLSLK